jgi:membrane-associated protease RseP (regulator of RpoE activity)
MRRNSLLIPVAFLTGIVAGVLAVGGYGTTPEPSHATGSPDISSVEQQRSEPKTGGPSATRLRAAALSPAPEESVSSGPGTEIADLRADLHSLADGWIRLQTDVATLVRRIDKLEQRVSAGAVRAAAGDASARPPRPATPEDRRAVLVQSGLAETRAEEILWRQGRHELDRLELRDVATREGWFGSDRYRDELALIDEEAVDLRAEIGEDVYDRYLFAAGEDNRVEIESIIPGSAAQEAGLRPGDLVESYGGNRVFTFGDLRDATSQGDRGELVVVRVRRDGGRVDAWLPRGPLGVRLDRARLDPDA